MGFFSSPRRVAAVGAFCLVALGVVGVSLWGGSQEIAQQETGAVPEISLPEPVLPVPPAAAPVVEPEEVEIAAPPPIEKPAQLMPQVVSPLDGTTVTVFSMTELMYDETMDDWRTHNGLDIQAGDGDAVKTAAAGEVVTVSHDELMSTTVVIRHSDGYVTTYASLQSDPPVSQGQSVGAGDIIGYVGTAPAESSMGPHLHFAVSRDGLLIDPQEYVR